MTRHLLLVLALGLTLAGCGKDDESLSKSAGRTIGESVTDFAKGVGTGVDKQMVVETELDPALAEKGVSKTISKMLLEAGKKGFTVYLISKDALTTTLMAKAMDKNGVEIGRTKTDVAFEKDGAQYVKFFFTGEIDTALVAKYVISLAPSAQPRD